MKTKLFTLFIAVVVSFGMAQAEAVNGIIYDLNSTELTAAVSSTMSQTDIGAVTIPTSISFYNKTYRVTSIKSHAFISCSGLTSITIPNSVTSIKTGAFSRCTNLTSVTLPDSITIIEDLTFSDCTSLTSINIPNGVTRIGGAFNRCTSLTSVTIPNSVTYIGIGAFVNCSSLVSIEIPNSVDSIEWNTFQGCTSLTSVTIPNSVTYIGKYAFKNCSSLASIEIPDNVTKIDQYAFENCTALTSLTIPLGVTAISLSAFQNCTSLKSITLHHNMRVATNKAFAGCTSLTSVTCYATTPPRLDVRTFDGVDCSHISLYVPAQSVAAYQAADQWRNFNPIQPISALPAETTIINIVPSDRSVDITWPSIVNAASYELVIKDKSGNIICTLVFNGQGQLVSIAYNAPARDNSEQQTQTAGFQFTVTGLDSDTEYDYTITAKDANGDDLNIESGSFTTTGGDNSPTGLDGVSSNDQTTKILHNNQILILRGDRTYTLTGAEVR